MGRPTEAMEIELEQLRKSLTEAHRAKRKETRQIRRLQRRCRVKANEDLCELEERYLTREHLGPLPEPGENALQQVRPSAKDFFSDLRSCRTSPRNVAKVSLPDVLLSARKSLPIKTAQAPLAMCGRCTNRDATSAK